MIVIPKYLIPPLSLTAPIRGSMGGTMRTYTTQWESQFLEYYSLVSHPDMPHPYKYNLLKPSISRKCSVHSFNRMQRLTLLSYLFGQIFCFRVSLQVDPILQFLWWKSSGLPSDFSGKDLTAKSFVLICQKEKLGHHYISYFRLIFCLLKKVCLNSLNIGEKRGAAGGAVRWNLA